MKPVYTFTVAPQLPPELERLWDVAGNLRWAWNHEAILLFRRLDDDAWEASGHNPARLLGMVDQDKLDASARDPAFVAHLDRVCRSLDDYTSREATWFSAAVPPADRPLIGYFSAEFGLTECLSIFAGGLGILAGDILKSASDLGVPLVGLGLLYQEGYFRQSLSSIGWQQEDYADNDFYNLPLTPERRRDGAPLTVGVPYPGRTVAAQVWRAQAGRVPLYLLDTNVPDNSTEDRAITARLYGGDREMRIKQEILLGIGGCRALDALGLRPDVCHLNEGHTAFVALERARRLMEADGVSFAEAREAAAPGLVFTTHTPEAAGHDYFAPDLMDRYFTDYAKALGLSRHDFLALGRRSPADETEYFCMTVLALRMAARSNGVSRLHGEVTRRMWRDLWPGLPEDEVPIRHVTNGVHFRSWISHEMDQLYDRYLGPEWRREPASREFWGRVAGIPEAELWSTHQRRRERLVAFVRRRLRQQMERHGLPESTLRGADEALHPEALTLVFARRFVPYKRPTLLLRDLDRLARLLSDPARPVQIIFAGKAHPGDQFGHEVIQQLIGLARQERFRQHLVFLEDYDIAMARTLTQGADVWLNSPRRPREACGTSGMKAAVNGALNLSTLDGWWEEAWQPPVGWALGRGEEYVSDDEQDQREAEALYRLLEEEVIPEFYARGVDSIPSRWVARMQASVGGLCSHFNSHRVVKEYTQWAYLPGATQSHRLAEDGLRRARDLAAWGRQVAVSWPQVRVAEVSARPPAQMHRGDSFPVRARVSLGGLTPEQVCVELYGGPLDSRGEITQPTITVMRPMQADPDDSVLYEACEVPCPRSGLHGQTIRVRPCHREMPWQFLPGYLTWAAPP